MRRLGRLPRPGPRLGASSRDSSLGASLRAPLAAIAALAAGAALWRAMALCQGALRPLQALLASLAERPGAPAFALEAAGLAANALVEEALRLALALGTAAAVRRLRLEPGAACLAVLSSLGVALLENLSYLSRFPTADVYWRLGYALPIHANAALLYVLALARPSIARAALALLAAWTWHASFNVAAALAPFPGLAALGAALNLCLSSALVAASAIRFGYWSVYAKR